MRILKATVFLLLIHAMIIVSVFAQQGVARGRQGKMNSNDGAPTVGELAPTFKLKSLDGESEFDLASFRGKKPVVLFFGSYT